MKFFSRESSEKLAKLGCKSESDCNYIVEDTITRGKPEMSFFGDYHTTQAFTPFDFLSDTEISKENCRKLWPHEMDWGYNNPICSKCGELGTSDIWNYKYCYEPKRYQLFDAPDQIAFIEGFLK